MYNKKPSDTMTMRETKRVSFASTQTLFFRPDYLTSEERKVLCWYTNEDLEHSRSETMEALRRLKEVDGNIDALDKAAGICLRGIEKYADAVAKYRNQKLFVDSVLRQQTANRQSAAKVAEEHLATLCRYMSQPSKEMALFYASRSAEEIKRILQVEEEEKTRDSSSPTTCLLIQVSELKQSDFEEQPTRCNSKKRSRAVCFDDISLRTSRKVQCCE